MQTYENLTIYMTVKSINLTANSHEFRLNTIPIF